MQFAPPRVVLFPDNEFLNDLCGQGHDVTVTTSPGFLWSTALVAVSEYCDQVEGHRPGHARNIAELSLVLGEELGLCEAEQLELAVAALLHDAGVTMLQNDVIRKQSDLTDSEVRYLAQHTQLGYEVAKYIASREVRRRGRRSTKPIFNAEPPLHNAPNYVLCHHERWDGGGYPRGLRRDEIPLPAQILRAADSYVSMVSPRPHRNELSKGEALAVIERNGGSEISTDLAQILLRKATYKPGRLSSVLLHLDGPRAMDVVSRLLSFLSYASEQGAHLRPGEGLMGAKVMQILARELKLSAVNQGRCELAALLRNTGMASIPRHLLVKQSPLSQDERKEMSRGPAYANRLVGQVAGLEEIGSVILSHRENYDGSGGPQGLHGEQIPFLSRLMKIADAYTALTHPRPWRRAYSQDEAIQQLCDGAGTQFDPSLVVLLQRKSCYSKLRALQTGAPVQLPLAA
jgi:HD-GYP domain-containing protein (c-di-GMP phosphodiesterase class II)